MKSKVISKGYKMLAAIVALWLCVVCVACNEKDNTPTHTRQTDEGVASCRDIGYTRDTMYLRKDNALYMGLYPQTMVTDSELMDALTSQAGTLPTAEDPYGWTSYQYYIEGSVQDYMWYVDIDYGEETYRGVYFTRYRPSDPMKDDSIDNTYQDDNGYTLDNVYWFRYDPIKWRVLYENDGIALLLCDRVIDSQSYYVAIEDEERIVDEVAVYPNNYQYSAIRVWLNETFYNLAFTQAHKQIIKLSNVDNSEQSTCPVEYLDDISNIFNNGQNGYACADTEDYVFLLSQYEVSAPQYGFVDVFWNGMRRGDTAREMRNTDYVRCQNGMNERDGSHQGNSTWWLRSPAYADGAKVHITNGHGVAIDADWADRTCYGVVPAMWIYVY